MDDWVENSQNELFGPSNIRCQLETLHIYFDPAHPTQFPAETPCTTKWYQNISSDNVWITTRYPTASFAVELSQTPRVFIFADKTIYYSWVCLILHCIPGHLRGESIMACFGWLFFFNHYLVIAAGSSLSKYKNLSEEEVQDIPWHSCRHHQQAPY